MNNKLAPRKKKQKGVGQGEKNLERGTPGDVVLLGTAKCKMGKSPSRTQIVGITKGRIKKGKPGELF